MKYLKTPLNMLLILAASTAAGILLLCLAFLLPASPMYGHVKNSSYIFPAEGEYPSIGSDRAKILDNYTDSIMLGNAVFSNQQASILERSLDIYRPQYGDSLPTYSLLAYLNEYEGASIVSYPRYWHGYLVFLKPLLLITGYLGIRTANRIVQLLLAAFILAALLKYNQKRLIFPFLAAFLFLRPAAVALSLQYSSVFYLSMLSILVIAVCNDKLKKGKRFQYYFLVLGIITNYIDFLTYPIATLGLSVTMCLAMEPDESCPANIRKVVLYSVFWGFGYFGMWIAKWAAASLLLRKNVFQDALVQARFRVSGSVDGHVITRFDAIYKNVMVGFGGIWIPASIIFAAAFLYGLWNCRFHVKEFLIHAVPYLLVCLMPFTWYAILQNHSFIHPAFTYRSLSAFVFAFLSMGLAIPAKQAGPCRPLPNPHLPFHLLKHRQVTNQMGRKRNAP